MTDFRRIELGTGVTLNVAVAGDPSNPPVILLHGFPESHRTWREVAPRLDDQFYLVMPDQRGFAGSDRPQDVDRYKGELLVDDVFALAEALSLESFARVGHDWGGAIAWGAALRGDPRLSRLAITGVTAFTNAPLRLWSALGALIAVCAILGGIWFIIEHYTFGADVPGWATLAVSTMFFSGVQLLSIGILGEYVGRIFDEVKQRPIYLVGGEAGRATFEAAPCEPEVLPADAKVRPLARAQRR